jgi:hypothetical protein
MIGWDLLALVDLFLHYDPLCQKLHHLVCIEMPKLKGLVYVTSITNNHGIQVIQNCKSMGAQVAGTSASFFFSEFSLSCD